MSEGTEIPIPGVHSMEHTADVAIEVTAGSADELFSRSAQGMMYLLLERIPDDEGETRTLEVGAADLPGLLREWLRELLYWHETEGFSTASCDVRIEPAPDRGSGRGVDPGADRWADAGTDASTDPDGPEEGSLRLEGTVRGGMDPQTPVREIKGVTLHGLAAERRDDGWYGRVIFDV